MAETDSDPVHDQPEIKPMTYWRLHYHLIWSTVDRLPTLIGKCETVFYGVLFRKTNELGVKVHAAGNVADHVHLVVSIPPKLAVADFVRHLKGASAHAINQLPDSKGEFQWQEGYGALSLGESSLNKVMDYAARQKDHHQQNNLMAIYEKEDDDK